ncbi:MAG: NUDIX hydrolase [Proteobacteria bacterium]|nr:MAG: NUDIX hydrolase [Pseudomonadota bacterium]
MHRKALLDLLARYRAAHPEEAACADRVRALVETHADCFLRTCAPGHVTASAWVLSPDGRRFLLTHHRKLGRWLQLGGHADGDPDVAAVALREAREESGLARLHFGYAADAPVPVDVDVHAIPARGAEPRHEHHDVRFVLVAAPGQTVAASDESHALDWFEMDALEDVADDDSVLRLGLKVRRLLAAGAIRLAA